MKNLYERLRPQVVDQMNEFATRYPFTVEHVTLDLRENYSITQMSIGSALFLTQQFNGKRNIDFLELSDLFQTDGI